MTANPNLVIMIIPEANDDVLSAKERLWWNKYCTVPSMERHIPLFVFVQTGRQAGTYSTAPRYYTVPARAWGSGSLVKCYVHLAHRTAPLYVNNTYIMFPNIPTLVPPSTILVPTHLCSACKASMPPTPLITPILAITR